MSVFDDLVGQRSVRDQLERAALAARSTGGPSENSAMSQAWLFTGPPGSGRSVAARMFAAALECTSDVPGCGECHACKTVMGGTHPDVEVVATQGVTISVDQTRQLVSRSFVSPGAGRWRILIVEDADRMSERTTNVLLKAIEEPPPFTVWMLCTPSPEDVMTTIRSRCRVLTLAVPRAEDIAELLVRRLGVNSEDAIMAARASQSHIGVARALLTDQAVREQRRAVIHMALSVRGVADAALGAKRVMAAAEAEVKERSEQLDARELADLKRSLGVDEGARVPPAIRAQLRELAENQKRRQTRLRRDSIDRAMVTILSAYRDVLTVQLGAAVELVNSDFTEDVFRMARGSSAAQSVERMDAIAQARIRLAANADPLLTTEAMLVALRP